MTAHLDRADLNAAWRAASAALRIDSEAGGDGARDLRVILRAAVVSVESESEAERLALSAGAGAGTAADLRAAIADRVDSHFQCGVADSAEGFVGSTPAVHVVWLRAAAYVDALKDEAILDPGDRLLWRVMTRRIRTGLSV